MPSNPTREEELKEEKRSPTDSGKDSFITTNGSYEEMEGNLVTAE